MLTETLVSLDVRDSQGRTALYLAAQRGFARCVEMLLKHGATCLLKDYRRKWTPLHAAGVCVCVYVCVSVFRCVIESVEMF